MKVSKTVVFDDERDADLLPHVRREMNFSATVREALRLYYAGGVTLQDIYDEVRALREAGLTVTLASSPQSEPPPAEPPDVAAALDELGR